MTLRSEARQCLKAAAYLYVLLELVMFTGGLNMTLELFTWAKGMLNHG